MRGSYKDFRIKYIPKDYGYSLTLDTDYRYINLWLANINLDKYSSIYLPFKYFDFKLYFVMSGFNSYREWKENII